MNREMVAERLLEGRPKEPCQDSASFFAPSNIALAKYWGKRNVELNLPVTSSLSISLGQFGAATTLSLRNTESGNDAIFINQTLADNDSGFAKRVTQFLNLFRPNPTTYFQIKTELNIPVSAGMASSACGFAALAGACDQLYDWQLSPSQVSILARLGSGSASRSLWHGFVEWQAGRAQDGMDSFGIPLQEQWPDLRVGLLLVEHAPKAVSSREAMQRTVLTSPFYKRWPAKQMQDFHQIKEAIKKRDFMALGKTSESNALAMHALMLTALPPISYANAHTVEAMQKIWSYRNQGLSLYFTQDAGPNLKLLFLEKERDVVCQLFPSLIVISPFEKKSFIC